MCLGISIQCYQEFVNKKMEIKDADAENLQINKLFRIRNIYPRIRAALWQDSQRLAHEQSKIVKKLKLSIRIANQEPDVIREISKTIQGNTRCKINMKIEILRPKLKENIVSIQSNSIYIYKVGTRPTADEVITFDDMTKEVFLEIKVEDNGNKFNAHSTAVYSYK